VNIEDAGVAKQRSEDDSGQSMHKDSVRGVPYS